MGTLFLIPDWQPLHPLIAQIPTALLFVAPIFILIGIFRPAESAAPYLLSALLLMTIGTTASYGALSTANVLGPQSRLSPDVILILRHHQSLAETTTFTFSALTLVFAAIVVVPCLLSRQSTRIVTSALPAVFLILYASGVVLLVDTAFVRNRLVHEFGITVCQSPDTRGKVDLCGHVLR